MKLYCCGCEKEVIALRSSGATIYPHRHDLNSLIFYACPVCKNWVGTHKDGKPLGVIPTPEIRSARRRIHAVLDPIWESGKLKRKEVYKRLSDALGYEYHTANIRSIREAEKILQTLKGIEVK